MKRQEKEKKERKKQRKTTKRTQKTEKKLNLRQEKFVSNYLRSGNATQSALAAWYAKTTANSKSSEMLWNDLIQERIRKACEKAQRKIEELIDSESENIALSASKDILDRGGYKQTEKISVSWGISLSGIFDEIEKSNSWQE